MSTVVHTFRGVGCCACLGRTGRKMDSDVLDGLLKILRRKRRARKWSQGYVANLIGLNVDQFGRLERGECVYADRVFAYADVMGFTVVFEEEEE